MLGDTFRTAREAKGVTTSEAAAATNMKMQHVEALEQEDFSVIAAAAYAKGFIRLYAEYLELDDEPLLTEYTERFMPQKRQPIMPAEETGMSNSSDEEGFSLSSLKEIEWPFTFSKRLVASVLGGLCVLVVLISLLSMLSNARQESKADAPEENMNAPIVVQRSASSPVLIQGPPEPFIDLYERR